MILTKIRRPDHVPLVPLNRIEKLPGTVCDNHPFRNYARKNLQGTILYFRSGLINGSGVPS